MITYEIISKCGGRKENEDYTGAKIRDGSACFVLADGLGGHGGGAEASRLAVEAALACFGGEAEASQSLLEQCFEKGQEVLLEAQRAQGRENEMKTTLVILMMNETFFWWGHIGDSRLYYFKDRKLQKRTLDHSVPQMLVAAGEIREKEIRGHADRNRLLRVMGAEWERPQYQIAEPVEQSGRSAFLLCSDGFWELIEEKQMTAALRRAKTPGEWLDLMEREVVRRGKGREMDNYSAIAVMAGWEEKWQL